MKKISTLLLTCYFLSFSFTTSAQLEDVVTGLNGPLPIIIKENTLYIGELQNKRIISVDLEHLIPRPIQIVPTDGYVLGFEFHDNTLLFADGDAIYHVLYEPDPYPYIFYGAWASSLYLTEDDTLYYSTYNEVQRIDYHEHLPVSETVIHDMDNPFKIVGKDNVIYVTETNLGTIVRMDLNQSNPSAETILTGLTKPSGLVIYDKYLYIAEKGKVVRANVQDPNPELEDVATGLSNTLDIAIDESELYISQYEANKISKLELNTTATTNSKQFDLNISPNPANDKLNISLENIQQIKVYDNIGRLMIQLSRPGKTIDISSLPVGFYSIKLISEQNIYSTQFIKK